MANTADETDLYAEQVTAGNLDSFEDSFVPAGPPPAPLGNKPRPKTPSVPTRNGGQHGRRTASGASQGSGVVRDAAGFITQDGGRGVFGREDAVVDMSRADDSGNRTRDASLSTRALGDADDTGINDSSEAQEPQRRSPEAAPAQPTPARGNARGKAAAGSSRRDAGGAGGGAKQQLTLREQEKVSIRT